MEPTTDNFVPKTETDNAVPQAEQQAQQRKTNAFALFIYTCITAIAIGIGGLILSVFSLKIRKRWKVWLTLSLGGYVLVNGYVAIILRNKK